MGGCPILKEDRWSICEKNCHIIRCIENDSFEGYDSGIEYSP
jgi:hypothetical protein